MRAVAAADIAAAVVTSGVAAAAVGALLAATGAVATESGGDRDSGKAATRAATAAAPGGSIGCVHQGQQHRVKRRLARARGGVIFALDSNTVAVVAVVVAARPGVGLSLGLRVGVGVGVDVDVRAGLGVRASVEAIVSLGGRRLPARQRSQVEHINHCVDTTGHEPEQRRPQRLLPAQQRRKVERQRHHWARRGCSGSSGSSVKKFWRERGREQGARAAGVRGWQPK
jgi:hypothetical protein